MNQILLIAPTIQPVSVPVILDLRQHSGAGLWVAMVPSKPSPKSHGATEP